MKSSTFMSEKEFVPFAVEILVSNFSKSLDFYQEVLGFSVLRLDKKHRFATVSFNKAIFMIKEVEGIPNPRGRGVVLRFLVKGDLKKYHQGIKSKSVKIIKPLQKMDYGAQRFFVEDPDGYQLKFYSR